MDPETGAAGVAIYEGNVRSLISTIGTIVDSDAIFRQADVAYEGGDFATALDLFFQAAEKGDCTAMTRFALMFDNGEGTQADIKKSIYWDLKAIEAGSSTSRLNLAISYRRLGDFGNAEHWFGQALQSGDGEAALELAKLYIACGRYVSDVEKVLKIAIASGNLIASSDEEARGLLNEIQSRKEP